MAAVLEFTPEKVLGSWVPLTHVLDTTARWQAASSCRIQTPSPRGGLSRGILPLGACPSSPRPETSREGSHLDSACWPGTVSVKEMCI